jgi:NAD(P)-dependent dehydrogenase (short-subunit alcohol dehydrogenase family)
VIALADLYGVSDELASRLKTAAKEAGRSEPMVVCCEVDIASLYSIQAIYENVFHAFTGHLDVPVNNAAHMVPY